MSLEGSSAVVFAKADFGIILNSRARRISHLVICLKKPSASSSLRKRVLTKSSGFLRLTAGTRCAAGMVIRGDVLRACRRRGRQCAKLTGSAHSFFLRERLPRLLLRSTMHLLLLVGRMRRAEKAVRSRLGGVQTLRADGVTRESPRIGAGKPEPGLCPPRRSEPSAAEKPQALGLSGAYYCLKISLP